jgi:hypothetical protein
LTHLLVAVDKFTKWIEAKPIKKLDGSSTKKFFNEIIIRYGVPHSIIDAWLTWELLLLQSLAMVPEKLLDGV